MNAAKMDALYSNLLRKVIMVLYKNNWIFLGNLIIIIFVIKKQVLLAISSITITTL